MNKIFKLISILPALLVLPAMAVNVSNWSDFVTSIKTAGETTSLDNDLIMYEMMGPRNGVINGNGNTLKALSISGTPELVNTQSSYEWQYTNVNGDVVKFYSEKSSLSAINATEVFSDPEMQNSLGHIDYKSGDKFDISGRGTTKNYTVVMDEEGFVNGVYKAEPTSATAKNTYYTVCLQDVDSGEKLYVAKSMKITEDGYTVDQILSQNSLTYTTDLERQNTIAGKGVSAGQDGEYTVAFPDILVLDNNGSFIAKPHKEYVVDGESIYISATANIDTTKTVYVNPDLSGSVVVDRTGLIPSFHGVNNTIYLGSNGTDLTINDLTMSDFVYNSSSNYGAVLTSKNANLTVNNSTFKNNTNNDTLLGGAVSILGDKATFTNTTFDNNTAKGAGAGLMIGNNVLAKGSILDRTYEYHNSVVSIKDSVFKNNSTIDVGGAVYSTVVNHSEANKRGLETVDNEVIINGTSFVSNHADKAAGAIGNFSKMTIQTSGFSHNTTDGQGGVMFLGAESKTLISRSMFENNSAGTLGGVIRTRDASEANNQAAKLDILSGTQFLKNSAENGGVLYNNFYDSKTNAGSVTVLGATFLDNTANENGGAIFNSGDKDANNTIGNINITDTTFAKNSAKNGGAVYNAGDMKITDTRNYRNSGYMFKENSVSANGGAIYNTGNLELNKVSFLDNSASANGGAIYNAGTLVLSGANEFSGNKAQNSANDIYNVGDLTIANGTTTIDGGIAGAGDLTIADGSTLNIGSAKINQNNITLNGTLVADLFADGDAFLTATQSFEGNGNLSVAVEKVGTYNIFGDKVFANAKNQIISSVFDLTWSQDGKSFDASLKSADKIVEDTGAAKETVNAVLNIASSDSEQLKDLSIKMQEKLATHSNDDIAAVEDATKSVHPETESVVQSVATSVQTTVGNLAATRMSLPTIGRAGGDIKPTGAGFWANGLYNYTNQKDSFDGYTRGFAIGMDGVFNKVVTVGTGYSYSHSDIDSAHRDTEIDSYTMFVYGQYKPNQWYANAVLNYTISQYSETGSALGIGVKSDYDVHSFGGRIATGYDFANGVTPELGLRYTHIDADDYKNNLGVKHSLEDTDYMTLTLGGKYTRNFNTKHTHISFAPEFHGLLKYDVMSDDQVAVVTMPGVNSYSISGDKLSKFGAEFGVGLTMRYYNADWTLDYDLDVRDEYISHTGRIKWKYNF